MSTLNTIGNVRKAGHSYGITVKRVTNIKQLSDKQLDEVVELTMGNHQYNSDLDKDGWGEITKEDVKKYVMGVLETRNEFITVALDMDKVCGLILGGHRRRFNVKRVNIYDLYVPKDYRKQGIAKSLLDSVYSEKIEGIPLVVGLMVYNNNDNALDLYKGWGMEPVVSQLQRMERTFK